MFILLPVCFKTLNFSCLIYSVVSRHVIFCGSFLLTLLGSHTFLIIFFSNPLNLFSSFSAIDQILPLYGITVGIQAFMFYP